MTERRTKTENEAGGVVSLSELRWALVDQKRSSQDVSRLSKRELQALRLRIAHERQALRRIKEGASLRGRRRQLLLEKCRLKEVEYQQAHLRLEYCRSRWREAMRWVRYLKRRRWIGRIRRARRESRKQYRHWRRYQRLAERNQTCIGLRQDRAFSGELRQYLGRYWQLENKKRVLHLKLHQLEQELSLIDHCIQQLGDFENRSFERADVWLPNAELRSLLLSGELLRILREQRH
mgnify:CR=1 FL=1